MHRIDTATAQKDKFGAGKNGFTRGNPQTGTPATALDDDYCDMLQEELAAVVEASGTTLDKEKHNQLLTALGALLLSRKNPFADIKADGAAAIATALANLGLKEAAKREVGTGTNQIPDMGAFASGSGWFKLPSGHIVQFGTYSGNTTRFISGNFPIPFPTQPLISISVMSDAVQSNPSGPISPVLYVNFEHISNSSWRVLTSDNSQQYRFSYISIGR